VIYYPLPTVRRCGTLSIVRKVLVGTLVGLLAALAVWLLGFTAFFQTIELKTYDWRVAHTANPATARQDIVLVSIDNASIRSLEPHVGRWPWPRLVHAHLIDYLARAPARLIVYDVLFSERDVKSFKVGEEMWTGKESDDALVEATAKAGNVIHVAEVSTEAMEGTAYAPHTDTSAKPSGWPSALGAVFETRPAIVPPFDELARASRAVGHSLLILDPDGPVRRAAPFVIVGGLAVPALPVAAAMSLLGTTPASVTAERSLLRMGPVTVPLVEQALPSFPNEPGRRIAHRMLIRYPGPVLSGGKPTYPDFSFYDLFYSEQQLLAGVKPDVDPARFKDKIVIIGTTAPGLSDLFTTPFVLGKMPGMQVHASVVDNVLSSRFTRPAPGWVAIAVLVAAALAVALVSMLASLWITLAVTASLLAVLTVGSLLLFERGIWLQLAAPALGVAVASFSGIAYQYVIEGREKRVIKRLFARYVAPDVFHHLMTDPSRARLGGDRREMTVLFSDIRGFTTVTERGNAEDIVSQLNEYFTRMVAVLFDYRGTLDKFVGDMVMALFGAPLEDPDHAEHAVEAALAMRRELAALNRDWSARGRPELDIGIGINSGEMVAGNIGSAAIMSYTVIGDAVNLGSRLESLNKQYGTHIIISESTRQRLKGRYHIHPLGEVVVKGKSESVAIFEIGEPGEPGEAAGTAGGRA
jgi:adenylate cyclase